MSIRIKNHPNGAICEVVDIVSGKENGLMVHFCDDGKLGSLTPYRNGLVDGVKRRYYPNGSLDAEISYKNGVLDGEKIRYNPDGTILERSSFVNGKLHGISTICYETGEIKKQTMFVNGKRNGRCTYYSIIGIKEWEVDYLDDKPQQTVEYFWGQLYSKSTYDEHGIEDHATKLFFDTKGNNIFGYAIIREQPKFAEAFLKMGWSRKDLLKYFNTNQHTIAAHIIFEHLYPYHYKDYCVAEEELHQAMEKLDKAYYQGMHFNVAKHRFYGIEFREKILHEQLGPDYYKECEYLGIRPISIDE